MSSSIDNLPNSTEEQIDPDVDNILNSLQNEYEDNNNEVNQMDENNYMNNNYEYNQDFNDVNQVNIDNSETNTTTNTSLLDNILGKCREPLIVLIVVFLINNNFTLSVLKNIPHLTSDGLLNMVGYSSIAIIIAITFFVLNIVSTQFV